MNSYKNDANTESNIQEDIKMYPNYLKGLEDYSKAKLSLYKLIKDNNETKTNSLQPKENYIKGLF